MELYNATGFPFRTLDFSSEQDSSESETEASDHDVPDTDYHVIPRPAHKAINKAKRQERQKTTKAPAVPLQKASILLLAHTEDEAGEKSGNDGEKQILARIIKCRDLGMSDTTPEAEARTALAMASRMMTQYNINLTEIEQQAASRSWERGESRVRITRQRGKSMRVSKEAWSMDIANAMVTLFDAKPYSTNAWDRSFLDWTFVGIAQNTKAAAQAFELVYNLICEWARGRRSANNYCRGVARGFSKIAKETREQERQDAIAAEKAEQLVAEKEEHLERQKLLARLKHRPVATSEEPEYQHAPDEVEVKPDLRVKVEDLSDDGNEGRGNASEGEALNELMEADAQESHAQSAHGELKAQVHGKSMQVSRASSISGLDEEESTGDDSVDGPFSNEWSDDDSFDYDLDDEAGIAGIPRDCPEAKTAKKEAASANALSRYHREALDIAEEEIKARKLRKCRSKYFDIRDRNAYQDGVNDARDIDIKRKRIQDGKSEDTQMEVRSKRQKSEK